MNFVYDFWRITWYGAGELQKSGVTTNRFNSAFNSASSLGVSEITQIYGKRLIKTNPIGRFHKVGYISNLLYRNLLDHI